MKIIGLSGPSGAGKGKISEAFEALGIPCIDTDKIYHTITSHPSDCLMELKEKFGEKIISENGSLDRVALAKLVFEGDGAKENLEMLNEITHHHVWNEVNLLLTEYKDRGKIAAVIDAPALFATKIFVGACDFIISILADKEVRLQRIIIRDGIERERALARINAQPNDEFYIKNSDYYIYNSSTVAEMNKKLFSILEQEGISIK